MNSLAKSKSYNGFIVKQKEFVKDINSDITIFEHEKTGAKLMYIANDDNNKTFTIGFKTPPKDNTGVMHILEHSVLCGSKKFPTKGPFVELCKGSLNTFLNAMTYSDKTVYPVASTNEKDFFNLMHVYLDAVFNPNIYENDKIFKQEGWHYHIEDEADYIDYKGVVYNEMKGVFSSPINRIYREVEATLFPDNNYAYESGGSPDEIPELTYEDFIKTHKSLYHPSNSYIALYGDLDIDKAMSFIDAEYLSKFDKQDVNVNIEKQKPFEKRKEYVFEYSVSDEGQLENGCYISLNMALDILDNHELNIAMHMLSLLLIESEEAPLKQTIINEGLGEDVFCIYESEVLQPYITVIVKGASKDKKDKLKEVVENTLFDLIAGGINKELIEGCINSCEFAYREMDASSLPKGLYYSLSSMGAWIHGINPIEKLKFEDAFKSIKKALTEPYFEKIIEEHIFKNNHASLVVLEPKLNLDKEEDLKLRNKLKELKSELTTEQLSELVNQTKELLEYQAREDSQEDLEKIPMLSINDIEKEAEDLKVQEYDIDGVKLLHYDTFTEGINYISTMFDVSAVKEEDVSYIGLLSDLLTRVGTNKRDYIELSNDVMKNTGEIGFYTKEYINRHCCSDYTPVLEGFGKALSDKTEKCMELMIEIINDTSFEDEKRIREIIVEKISEIEMEILSDGDNLAISRMNSYFNPVSKYIQRIHGLEYYKFLKDINENIEEKMNEIKAKLYEVKNSIFNVNNLKVSFIGDNTELDNIKSLVADLKASLRDENVKTYKYSFNEEILNEGLIIPSEVQYVAKGYNYKNLGYEYNGSMEVLKNVLRYGYLWNKIRVQGGAYGARFNITEFGNVTLCSYRDPNIKETINAYNGLSDYIKSLELGDRELDKAIIGAINSIQLPTSAYKKGRVAIGNYLTNKTTEDRQKQRDELLNTNVESLRQFAQLLEDVINKECHVVVGNDKINDNKELFKNIYNPLK